MRRLWVVLLLLVPAGAWAQANLAGGYLFSSGPSPAKVNGSWIFDGPVYTCNTADCGTNYERGGMWWSGDVLTIGTAAGGTGNLRPMFVAGSGNYYYSASILPYSTTFDLGTTSLLWRGIYSTSHLGSSSLSLTDAGAAVTVERLAVATNGYVGAVTAFTANSTDGTDRLTTSGLVSWAAADTGGTVTCGAPVVTGLVTAYRRANTLVCTFTAAVSTTNCDLQVTCTDNKAGVQTMSIEHTPTIPHVTTYTPGT